MNEQRHESVCFVPSLQPTLGVELELQIVDAEQFYLRNDIEALLRAMPSSSAEIAKRELFQCCVEINSSVCRTVKEAETELRDKLRIVAEAGHSIGLAFLWGGTHPFSRWLEQETTQTPRYLGLVDSLQDTARRAVTFGLHVHVGVDSGDKAILVGQRLCRDLPLLLALSANSPFWCGRDTGLDSQRTVVWDTMPRAGLPPQLHNWSEYVWLVNHLKQTGFISSIRDIYWNVRPHHNFGTVEVRICDMPASLADAMLLAAIIQCLVIWHDREVERGVFWDDIHPVIVQQNKWRASRHGLSARLVGPDCTSILSIPAYLEELQQRLRPIADEMRCAAYLDRLPTFLSQGNGAQRQRDRYAMTGSLVKVAAGMVAPE